MPDGKSVVSVGNDLSIRLWEYPSGKLLRRIDLSKKVKPVRDLDRYQELSVIAAALNKDGKTLATYFDARQASIHQQTIYLHDLTTGKELPGLQLENIELPPRVELGKNEIGVRALAFSPNGKRLAVTTTLETIVIWDWERALKTRQLNDRDPNLGSGQAKIIYAADGKLLATLHPELLRLWNAATETEVRAISLNTKPMGRASHLQFESYAMSPDGKTLAYSTSDNAITLVETGSGKEIRKLSGEASRPISLLFSKDGSKLYSLLHYSRLSTDGSQDILQEWDVSTGQSNRKFGSGPESLQRLRWPRTDALSLSPDGNTLVLFGRRTSPQFFDLRTGKETAVIPGNGASVQSLQFTPDGKSILTIAADGSARKGDAVTGKDFGMLYRPEQIVYAISADGKTLAVQLPDSKNLITLIDSATGKAVGELKLKQRESYLRMLFAPNGKTLAVRKFGEEKLELYEVPSAKRLHSFDLKTGAPQGGFGSGRTRRSNSPAVPQTLVFSANSQMLASYADAKMFATWNVTTGQRAASLALPVGNPVSSFEGGEVARFEGYPVQSDAFSPDGRCLAVDQNDGVVTVYELVAGQPRRIYGKKSKLPDNPDRITNLRPAYESPPGIRVAFSLNGKSLAYGGDDKLVHVWDVATGKELAAFKGHTGEINAVAFAPDGKTLASASADTTALVWDMTKVQNPATPVKSLSANELKAAWQTLAGDDAAKAFTAIGDLAAAPKETVPFLKEQVKPAAPLDGKRVEELLAKLDDEQAAVRQQATGDLIELGEQFLPVLEKTLAANPPLEVRKRLEEVRGKLTATTLKGEQLRLVRAVEVLQHIGTPEARQLLEALAAGAPAARLTREAKAALK